MKNTVNQKQLHDLLVKTIPQGLPVLTSRAWANPTSIGRQQRKPATGVSPCTRLPLTR
jgi:hypothetical protein